ncbi:MAG: FAD-linked oxidase C-terminal domain-containing protein [Thermodesulfobacteriota bacterium]|nr:FAD-linked oxidase C-terminal domain-containing protein [Thermodesulfobacteriota bacterium]
MKNRGNAYIHRLDKGLIKQITAICGKENTFSSREDLICYSYDATNLETLPDLVVFPKTTSQISEILRLANDHLIPVIPRGMGTGFSGGSIPVRGGVVLAMTRFNRVIEIDTENMIAVVEPGVVTGDFQKQVEKLGLFYPPDPASALYCTLGGNVAECAGGPRAVKYGVTKDYVLGMEVVLPTGEVVKTGVKTAKGVVGYDLTKLFVGSEGTLGIITQIILRLIPLPEAKKTMRVAFRKVEDAATAVSKIISSKIIPATLELMDNASIRCVENYLNLGLPMDAGALLLIEVDGDREILPKYISKIDQITSDLNRYSFEVAETEKEVEALWKARRALSPASYRLNPTKIAEDITVPRNQIATFILESRRIAQERGLKIINFGHAGDGNIHTSLMINDKDEDEKKRAEEAIEEIFKLTIQLGGTLSGEHGVGLTKAPYIDLELDRPTLEVMKKIKTVLDPNDILNPGKIFKERGSKS